MRRLFVLLFLIVGTLSCSAASGDPLLIEPVDTIIARIDRLIDSTPDSLKSDVAGKAFNLFSESSIMGHDAVAVHIADRYFLSKKLEWSDPQTYPMLYAYASFNRSSLIGNDSPDLMMESLDGSMKSLRRDASNFKLLYFYDPQCSTCARYSPEIADIARKYNGGRLSIFAINTTGDREAWKQYVADNFSGINSWKVDFYNLWDPEDNNDYRRKFGVLSTPSLLLIDSQNKIIGRSLDPESLKVLLGVSNESRKEVRKLFNQLFDSLAPVDTAVIAQIAKSLSVKSEEDSTMYREFFYELFNYLRDSPLASYQEGAAQVASEYITGRPDYWSREYLAKVQHALDSYRMNPLGSKAPSLILKDSTGLSVDIFKNKRSKYTLLFFHIVNCGDCRRESKVLESQADFLKSKKVRVVCIYAGKDLSLWKEFIARHNAGWEYYCDVDRISRMGEKYDIEFVPKFYLLDKRGRIVAKDIDAKELANIL